MMRGGLLVLSCLFLEARAFGDPLPEGTLESMPTTPAPLMEPGFKQYRSGLEKSVGDVIGSVVPTIGCSSNLGLGVAFDGENLWFSCQGTSPDLLRVDPLTGVTEATFNVIGGLGSIAYDCTDNSIIAGWGGGDPNGTVRRIQLDATQSVVGSAVLFNAGAHPVVCGLDDGIAIDVSVNPRQIYLADDCSTIIHRYAYDGTHVDVLDDSPWTGSGCYNSGLAIGGGKLYQGANGCNHIYAHDVLPWPMTGPNFTDFRSNPAGDPSFRDEGLACDDRTFPVDVMWSVEAYEPRRAYAFEVPPGTCQTCAAPVDPCDLPTPASVGAALRVRDHGSPNAPNVWATLDWSLDEGGPRTLGMARGEEHYHILRGKLQMGNAPTLVRIPNTEPWLGVNYLDLTRRAVDRPQVYGYVIKAVDACETESLDWPPSL